MDFKEAVRKRKEFETKLITKALEDENFRRELLSNPKAVIEKEAGQTIPEGVEVKIVEEAPNSVTIVLPRKPSESETTEELTDDNLEKVAGGLYHNEYLFNPYQIVPVSPSVLIV